MYLDKIVSYKKGELEHRKRRVSLKDVRRKAADTEPTRRFLDAVAAPGIRIIAEIKKASPSAGVIRSDFDPVKIAQIYEENGAAALSILTDEHFFQGSLDQLEKIRASVKIPLLRKDFTFDEYQIYEARAAGADAVLLIVRILQGAQMKDYIALVSELGMAALAEVHDEEEMKRAKEIRARLIGINNRDLDTFKVDLETTVKLAKEAPREAVLVSESGISTRDHIKRLKDCGVHAFLIGESLLREKDPGEKLTELLA
jgi:indole-3-glycerol phosphate synthase